MTVTKNCNSVNARFFCMASYTHYFGSNDHMENFSKMLRKFKKSPYGNQVKWLGNAKKKKKRNEEA